MYTHILSWSKGAFLYFYEHTLFIEVEVNEKILHQNNVGSFCVVMRIIFV